jgi:hypothetical protein
MRALTVAARIGSVGTGMDRMVQLRRLMEQRDRLLKEVEALKNKIAGLDMAIGLIGETPVQQEIAPSQRKIHVSETIVSLLREAGETGLKPKAAIALAAERGISLNRGSVYSLLNRMARNGTVVHEDTGYKLTEFEGHRERALFLSTGPSRNASNH